MSGHNTQLKHAIADAIRNVEEQGYKNVEMRDVMLAGFGYLANKVEGQGVVIKIQGRLAVALGTILGAALVYLVEMIMRYTR